MLKKVFKLNFLVILFLLLPVLCFSQTENSVDSSIDTTTEKKSIKVVPYFTTGLNLTLNLASKDNSAPSPLSYIIGGGAILNITDFISIEPRLDFWTMYYLFDGKDALPAEIEHRTSTVLCFMLDIPVGFNFRKNNHTFTPGAGLGILARFSFLSNGIKDNDKGVTGSAKEDASKIASWFWSNARFLYPEIFFAWDYKIAEKLKVGLIAKIYFPFGSIISGHGLDATIINISTRLVF